MQNSILRAFLVFALFFTFSCQEEEIPSDPISGTPTNPTDPINPPVAYTTADISIDMPSGVTLDLSKAKIVSGVVEYRIEAGKAKIRVQPGGRVLAMLVDDKDQMILAGYITDSEKTLSPASTAAAILSWRLGISLLPLDAKKKYWTEHKNLTNFSAYVDEITNTIQTNPTWFHQQAASNPLDNFVSKMGDTDTLDIRARSILVSPTSQRSGIQIYEKDFQNIGILNYRRRRAHAFVYKTAYKDRDGLETIIKSKISQGDVSEKDLGISPTTGITGFIGTINEWSLGKGMEMAVKEFGPVNLPLASNESEATYNVRVVGPGLVDLSGSELTNAEKAKLRRLSIETFAMDFLLPFIFDIVGAKDLVGIPESRFATAIELIDAFVKTTPTLEKFCEDGNFAAALFEFLNLLRVEGLNAKGEDLVIKLLTFAADTSVPELNELILAQNKEVIEKSNRIFKTIKIIDLSLKLADYKRMTSHITMSDKLTIFTATAKSHNISLTPKEGVTIPFRSHWLKVDPKTTLGEGESFVYKWKTTGKFGVLYSGANYSIFGTSIETSTPDVNYWSEKSNNDLSPESNIDIVEVEVFVKKGTTLTRIGDAKAQVDVKQIRLVMKPDKITIAGGSNVRLYLERNDGVVDIVSNSALDYKVEWSTSGSYGKFDGVNKTAVTRGNSIHYEALDLDIKEGKESFTARVYFKAKNETNWTLREEVKGEVTVVNDTQKIIMNIPLEAISWNRSTDISCQVGVTQMAVIPVVPNAIRYSVTFYGFKKAYSWEGRTTSWMAGQKPAAAPFTLHDADNNLIYNNKYYFGLSMSWGVGPMSGDCGSTIPETIEFYKAFGGYANVVVTVPS